MRHHALLLGLSLVVAVSACTVEEPGGDSGSAEAGSTASEGSGNDTATGDPSGTGSSATAGPSETGAADSTGQGYDGDLGPCGRLEDCIIFQDDAITGFLATYGRDGTCWQEFTPEQCWQDCRAAFGGYSFSCPDDPVCCECESPDDCAYTDQFETCIDNVCDNESDTTGTSDPPDCSLLEDCEGFVANLLGNFCSQGPTCEEAIGALLGCVDAAGTDLCADIEECGTPGVPCFDCDEEGAAVDAIFKTGDCP